VGKVSFYPHHNGWWVYYTEHGQQLRQRVADDEKTAARVAAQINGHLMADRKVPLHRWLHEVLEPLPRKKGGWFFTAMPSKRYPNGDHHINVND